MNDMTATIVAKSDQINAADLIGNPRTITIREVRIKGDEDQPVSILIEGDSKAFRPCKGVRRLMVAMWGPDANKYIGQSLTLYYDSDVTWAGKKEGGIRVSHMTGIDRETVFAMRTSRTATKPYKIQPLKQQAKAAPQPASEPDEWPADDAPDTVASLRGQIADANGKASWDEARAAFEALAPTLDDATADELREALKARRAELMRNAA